jgi:hypothetical protein
MIVKFRDINAGYATLQKVFDSIQAQEGGWKRVIKLTPAYREVTEKAEDIDTYRNQIFRKYAVDTEEKDPRTGEKKKAIPPERQEDADREFKKMLDQEVEFEKPLKFTEAEVQAVCNPSEFARIFPFVRVDDEKQ